MNNEQRQFSIEQHTPQEARDFLLQVASNSQFQGPLNQAAEYIAAIQAAANTLQYVIDSKERGESKRAKDNT